MGAGFDERIDALPICFAPLTDCSKEDEAMSERGTAMRTPWYRCREAWRILILRFIPLLAALSLGWEIAQLPLYMIWREASPAEIAFAVLHCTLGDVAIGSFALLGALFVTRAGPPAEWRIRKIVTLAVAGSVAYTVFSEWLNVSVRHAWAYSDLMPVVPFFGTGISPVLQWVVAPSLAIGLALRGRRHSHLWASSPDTHHR